MTSLAYDDEGAGTPVVFPHGLTLTAALRPITSASMVAYGALRWTCPPTATAAARLSSTMSSLPRYTGYPFPGG